MAVFTGTSGNDTFVAAAGDNTYNALGGNDTITFSFNLTDATISYSGNQVIVDATGFHTVLTGFQRYQFADGTVDEADGNPLVADLFYYSQYDDVWLAQIDAEAHYSVHGFKEGRDPSAFFDTTFYLAQFPAVKLAGTNPLTHWSSTGWLADAQPSAAFDQLAYLALNPDVAAANVDPLQHFLQFGAEEGRQMAAISAIFVSPNIGSDGFDPVFYLVNNPDVAAAGVDPRTHFQQFGWHEGRNPNAYFDTDGYLANYADVAASGVNPLQHYNEFGWREGRDPAPWFDTSAYLDANPDVAAAGVNPLIHYLQFGHKEGREAIPLPFGDLDGGPNHIDPGAPAGTNVGATFSWGGWQGVTYSISITSDESNGGFTIDPVTGVITVADSSKVANNDTFTLKIVVSEDGHELPKDIDIVVGTGEPNQPPTAVGLANVILSTPENGGPLKVADIVIVDDGQGTNNLTLSGPDATSFVIVNGVSGPELHFLGGANSEAKSIYDVTVNVDDPAAGPSPDAVVILNLNITNVDEVAPVVTSGATATLIENSGTNQLIYTATATDAGDGGPSLPLTFSLGGTDAAAFGIDAGTGAVTLLGNPNFEGQSSYSFTVTATDAEGNASAAQAVTLSITNADEVAPVVTSGGTATLAENSGTNQLVYTATATDAGDGGPSLPLTFSLGGTDAAAFGIDAGTGAVTLLGNPNFEGQSSYSFTVTATDAEGNASAAQAVTLSITNEDEVAPVVTSGGTAAAIDENSGANQVVYTATATDVGDGGPSLPLTFSLGGTDAAAFDIDAGTGAVTLLADPNFEGQSSYSFEVTATDAEGNVSTAQTVSLAINDVNDQPRLDLDTTDGDITLDDGQPAGFDTQFTSGPTLGAIAGDLAVRDDENLLVSLTIHLQVAGGLDLNIGEELVPPALPPGFTFDFDSTDPTDYVLTITATPTPQSAAAFQSIIAGIGYSNPVTDFSFVVEDRVLTFTLVDDQGDSTSTQASLPVTTVDMAADVTDTTNIGDFIGGNLGDHIRAGSLGTTIDGLGGDDTIEGGAGEDTLSGGDGDDTIISGIDGSGDTVDGGSNTAAGDTLIFNALVTSGTTVLLDWTGTSGTISGPSFAALQFTDIENVEVNVDGPDSVIVGSDLTAAGVDSLTIHADIDTDFIDVSPLTGGTTFIDAGTGNDEIILGGAADTVHFTGAFGDDTVDGFTSGSDQIEIDGGVGATYTVDDSNAPVYVITVFDSASTVLGTITVTTDGDLLPSDILLLNAVPNDPPVAQDDTTSTDEDTPVTTGNVLDNDSDTETALTAANITDFDSTSAQGGTVTSNGDGTFNYTPADDFHGPDSFTYEITDGNGASDTATVTITVASVNDDPVAQDDADTTDEDTPISGNVLANDSDDSTPLTGASITAHDLLSVHGGTVVHNGGGNFTYTPAEDFSGTDTFSYTITDGDGASDTATVTITVNPVSDAPLITSAPIAGAADDATIPITVSVDLTDPSEVLGTTVTISGVPAGYELNAGGGTEDGVWTVPLAALPTLAMVLVDEVGSAGTFELTVEATSQDGTAAPAPATATISGTISPAANTQSGFVLDGYVAGAVVFADKDHGSGRNGILDPDEVSTTTAADGSFVLIGADPTDPLVMFGGTDISTGLAFIGTMSAPPGSTVVTPLTTLVAELVSQGQDVGDAQTAVLDALGLPNTIDLTTFDAVAATANDEDDGAAVLAAAIQVQTTIAQLAAAAGTSATSADVTTALANTILNATGTVDLTDSSVIEDVANDAGLSPEAVAGATQVVAQANQTVADATGGGDPTAILSGLAQAATVALGAATDQLATTDFNDTDSVNALNDQFTGTALTDAVEAAPVGIINLPIVGTIGNDTLQGTTGKDAIDGLEGNDSLSGLEGDDLLSGGAGRDALTGGAGDDWLEGGDGADRAVYAAATAGINVQLAAGTVTGGDASVGSDTLRGVEGVRGTNHADTFDATGFTALSVNGGGMGIFVSGGVGPQGNFNEFEGLDGDDVITGNGATRISYENASAGVTVNLQAGTAQGTALGDLANVGSDDLNGGIAQVRGSAFADSLTGSPNGSLTAEAFEGMGGDDFIDGNGGFDRVRYDNQALGTLGIQVNLAAGEITGRDAAATAVIGTDQIRSIEVVRGSNGADVFNAVGFAQTGNVNNGGDQGNFNEFEGMAGNDQVFGNGNTRLAFTNATGGVTVNIADGIANGDASVGSDTFSGVNAVRGSSFNDTLTGSNNGNNTVEQFDGWSGNDTINGGNGFDRARYDVNSSGNSGIPLTLGVAVDLAAGTVLGLDAYAAQVFGADTLRRIESVRGTAVNDTYTAVGFILTSAAPPNPAFNTGDSGANGAGQAFNEFEGMGGDDQITGNGNTRISYAASLAATGVTVVLNSGSGTATGDAAFIGSDTITGGVNAVRGTNADDVITVSTASAFGYTLEGLGGADQSPAAAPVTA